MRRRALTVLIGLAAVLALLAGTSSPASADYDALDVVEAVVTGETDTGEAPPILDPDDRRGDFEGLAIVGYFQGHDVNDPGTAADDDVSNCVTQVAATNVGFETNETLASGTGTIDSGATFTGTTDLGGGTNCSVNGSVGGGDFVRVGTVALADIRLHFTVDKEILNTVRLSAEGRCEATVVVTATPDPTTLGATARIAGVVHCNGNDDD